MRNRETGFGRQFMGGFCRRDVVDYISKLSAERNGLAEENEKLREEIERLRENAASTQPPQDSMTADAADPSALALAETDAALEELERRYELLRADAAVCTSHMRCEMESAVEKLEKLSESLKKTGERISELRSGLNVKAAEK